jgi:hypothetical protein
MKKSQPGGENAFFGCIFGLTIPSTISEKCVCGDCLTIKWLGVLLMNPISNRFLLSPNKILKFNVSYIKLLKIIKLD